MKVVQLRSKHFQGVDAVALDLGDDGAVIGGNNGQGKSSCGIDALIACLCGAGGVSEVPVKRGESKGSVSCTIDDGEGGEIIVTREMRVVEDKATGKQETRQTLVVTDGKGRKYPTPQKMLDAMWGRVAFNPGAFIEMKPKEQRAMLASVVGVEDKINELDDERVNVFFERTDIKREVRRLQSLLDSAVKYDGEPDELVSVAELSAELQAANKLQADKDRASEEYDRHVKEAARLSDEIDELTRRLKEATEKRDIHTNAASTANEAFCSIEVPDIDAIQERLNTAEFTNEKIRANQQYDKTADELEEAQEKADAATERLAQIDHEKLELVKGAKLPIDGLSIGDNGVLLNGIPLEQASTAEALSVACAIGAAMDPKLKVLLIKGGAYFDDATLESVRAKAREMGWQYIIEVVGTRDGCTVVIEGGRIKK